LTDFALGDVVTVEMSNGRMYPMTLVGAVRDQNAEPSINSGGINLYTTLETFAWLGETANYNRLLYVAAENQHDPDHIKALTGEIKDKMERSGLIVYFTLVFAEPGVSPVKFIIETIRIVLGILASVSLVLSAFLVFNTMSALIMRQVKFIGIMKSIGANTPALVRMYLLLVIAFGLMAFLVAAPPAAWAAWRFAQFIASPQLTDLALARFSSVAAGGAAGARGQFAGAGVGGTAGHPARHAGDGSCGAEHAGDGGGGFERHLVGAGDAAAAICDRAGAALAGQYFARPAAGGVNAGNADFGRRGVHRRAQCERLGG
jgi:hypothetical protein